MCWNLLGLSRPTKAQIRPALHCTHPGEDFQIWKRYTPTFCHKLSRKTFRRLCSRWMEKTPTCSHHGGKHVVYINPGEGFQIWKQYTLSFCHKLSRKTFWQLYSRWMEKTPTCSHCSGKHVLYNHPSEGFQFWKQYSLTFSQKKLRRKRHQLAHNAHQHMLLRNYLPGNICSDINGKPMQWELHFIVSLQLDLVLWKEGAKYIPPHGIPTSPGFCANSEKDEAEFLVTLKFGVLLQIRSNWAKHSEFTPKLGAPRLGHHFCSLSGWKILSMSWDMTKWRCL